MNMGSWILLLYAVIGVVMLVLWWSKSSERGDTKPAALSGLAGAISRVAGLLGVLSWIQLVLSVLLIAYTGVLLSASNQPMWAGVLLLPALFVASAISTGMAMLVLVLRTGFGRWVDSFLGGTGEPVPNDILHTMGIASIALGIIEIVVLVGYIAWLAFFSGAAGAAAVAVLLTGPMSLIFWGGVVLVGLVIPLVLEVVSVRGKEVVASVLASASLILLGGFFLRAAVLLGGQLV
jgi:formate-dependent nitrite reductase membrane component NrfD